MFIHANKQEIGKAKKQRTYMYFNKLLENIYFRVCIYIDNHNNIIMQTVITPPETLLFRWYQQM